MNRLRLTMGVLGGLAIGYGMVLAVTGLGLRSTKLVLWLAGPVAVHDGVVVPLALALGWTGRRVLPRAAWGPAAAGLVLTGTVVALGATVLNRPGQDPTLPSLLDRNYPAGFAIALGLVWTVTAIVAVVRVRGVHRAGAVPSDHGTHG